MKQDDDSLMDEVDRQLDLVKKALKDNLLLIFLLIMLILITSLTIKLFFPDTGLDETPASANLIEERLIVVDKNDSRGDYN